MDRRVQRGGNEQRALAEARSQLRRGKRRGALAVVAGFLALLSALVGATLGWLDAPLASSSWLASLFWLVGMLVAWNRARSARRLGEQAETRAWVDVAEEAVASFPGVTEQDVAELLGVDRPTADDLLTELVREERATSAIDEQARVVFRSPSSQPLPQRMRVDELEPGSEHEDEEGDAERLLEPPRRRRL